MISYWKNLKLKKNLFVIHKPIKKLILKGTEKTS